MKTKLQIIIVTFVNSLFNTYLLSMYTKVMFTWEKKKFVTFATKM